jgi:hypothetical protein
MVLQSPPAISNVIDLDSHEFLPAHLYPKYFGEVGYQVMQIFDMFVRAIEADVPRDNDLTRPEITADIMDIDPLTIGRIKGSGAPGAIDMRRRMDVRDAMGVDRQLVFPSFGFIGLLIAELSDDGFRQFFTIDKPMNHRQIGLDAIHAHNN